LRIDLAGMRRDLRDVVNRAAPIYRTSERGRKLALLVFITDCKRLIREFDIRLAGGDCTQLEPHYWGSR